MIQHNINLENLENLEDKDNKSKKTYIFDYEIENSEDELFQKILVFSENIYQFEKSDDLVNTIGYYYNFLTKKIDYLEGLQTSFGLSNTKNRFKNISNYLDYFLTGETQYDKLTEFSIKISGLLDQLYTVKIILSNYYIYVLDEKYKENVKN